MNGSHRLHRLIVSAACMVILLACAMPFSGSTAPDENETEKEAQNLEHTAIALEIKSTLLAEQQATFNARESQPQASPTSAQANIVAEIPASPTALPTLAPSDTPVPTATPEPPTPTAVPTKDIKAKIQAAKVLVYEDIRGYPDLDTRVHSAIDNLDFSKGRVVEVGDAVGDFMTQLNSPVKWDLIIVAAEARSGVRGEFWDVITEHVNRGAALVVEIWYLDDIAGGRIAPLLGKCGVKFQRDLPRDEDADPLNYSLYWLEQDHPLFSFYNVVGPLYTPNIYWYKDAGDQIRLGSGGDAVLLSGMYPNQKSSYGMLAVCLEGRMVLQTFSSHDYRRDQVVPLWENYILYTLNNHFAAP